MAKALDEEKAAELREQEARNLRQIEQDFMAQGKEFIVPDEHWSGVMPEEYRSNVPGKKDQS